MFLISCDLPHYSINPLFFQRKSDTHITAAQSVPECCSARSSLRIKSQEEFEKNLQIMREAKKHNTKSPPQKRWPGWWNMGAIN